MSLDVLPTTLFKRFYFTPDDQALNQGVVYCPWVTYVQQEL